VWSPHRRSSSARAGDRIKTDARDAAHLARLLRLGEITEVRVPDRDIEAVRDLVRAREDARADLMRVRHRLSKLLLRQGIVYYGGTPWTGVHEQWLRRQRFDEHQIDHRSPDYLRETP
jgi:transposase